MNKGTITLLGFFITGLILGGLTVAAYFTAKTNEEQMPNTALVDFVIADWTRIDTDEVVEASDPLLPEKYIAQFSASKELPMARLGFFPDTVRTLAKEVEAKYKVPVAVTLAQWALESGFGKRNLGASNYFGHTFAAVKEYMSVKKFVLRRDKISVAGILIDGPERKFASYQNIADCFTTHGKYLSQCVIYRAAFFTGTPENFARVIAMRYAQDPNYAVKLITIMRRYNLE